MENATSDVLVVAHRAGVRTVLHTILTDAGYAVCDVSDVTRTLERLRSHPRRLVVVVDWLIPGLDGLDMLRALAAADASVARQHAFILQTARYDGPTVHFKLPPGVSVTVIGLPFTLDALLDAVAQAVQRQ